MLRENSKSLESTRTLWRKNMGGGGGRFFFKCYCYYFSNLPFFTFWTSFQFSIFFVLNFLPTISRRFISFFSSQRQDLQQQSDELRKNVSCKVTRFFVLSHIFTACLWYVFFFNYYYYRKRIMKGGWEASTMMWRDVRGSCAVTYTKMLTRSTDSRSLLWKYVVVKSRQARKLSVLKCLWISSGRSFSFNYLTVV